MSDLRAYRAELLDFTGDPGDDEHSAHLRHHLDGVLLVENGHVVEAGPAAWLLPQLGEDVAVEHFPGRLLLPGFVDAHIHYAQTDVVASYGADLLDWLQTYTFPAERAFADADHAAEVAQFFIRELLRNGTTTALVMATVHPASVDALFAAARPFDLRLIAGKVMMDRHCPPWLQDSAASGYADSLALIERWHGQGRFHYAVTPRFAPTSSDEQLAGAGRLAALDPSLFVHSHVAESPREVEWVAELFPWARSYLDVYDRFGLLRRRALYAHCIHLDAQDRARMCESGAGMIFCPTSNLFLGSGLLDVPACAGAHLAVGTDIGGGTSFSLLSTLAAGYKVTRLAGHTLTPLRGLYLATLGGACALDLDGVIGSFAPGREADFIVLDPTATPLLARRTAHAHTLAEKLFALIVLGDDRVIERSYVMGRCVHQRD
ncbi:guanine deaminase [Plasticicumulans acidivorans]|uniref:Guanine deaminase n=1 Tax=Plasticicumulans acidivorans TaxID=886464 RepID=A0A317MUR9_9GAMM|nr:guanine deaminase [Plasticicumulans acidivorans]PWV61127.1 guanine deaminase [Plasticicumulans acidivorans]